ncbi:2-phosphosulfolactate phosphatase [Persicimonas caeni]|uniref:Probable 2-phosphosulfolactate phosphatase n=1 Tax=Persicimonas caeni TaxID=2292766 RepID=A0A4Y6PTH4_PERCE|nr:2-phosphosulfolactate phosphatase [Persicimonas caeni]QDG51533.1 2-phosphosulfolactate phosphatase [Persicimonas caeni]QED32754.1 2-phosphosulfolactate phosphatase [Persicimonas caeni]
MTQPTIAIFQGHTPELPDADVNVVIDVIRAFTTTHVAFLHGATEVLLAGEVDEAFALKEEHPDYVLAGERDAIKIEGFDLGNSPFDCAGCELDGHGMILSTTNGVRATLHAMQHGRDGHDGVVLVTGYTNAQQTADHIHALVERGEASRINLVASNPTGDDDLACAEFIRDRILGHGEIDHDEVVRRIRACESAQKFIDPTREKFDRRDIEMAMVPRGSNFVMLVLERNGQPVVEKEDF